MPAVILAIFFWFKKILALFQLFSFLWGIVGKALMFSWPVSLVLLAILISEFPHAPKRWERRFCCALTPIAIQVFMVTWAVASIALPFLKFQMLGFNLGMGALALQIAAAAYAWRKIDEYRCFFLALFLNELWVGFWCSLIAGAIISRPSF